MIYSDKKLKYFKITQFFSLFNLQSISNFMDENMNENLSYLIFIEDKKRSYEYRSLESIY